MESIQELLFKSRKILAKPTIQLANIVAWKIMDIIWDPQVNNFQEIYEVLEKVQWKKIAIIWNSPIIEKWNYWQNIDNYDVVIRINKWILEKYLDKETTGEKTDIWCTIALDTILSPKVFLQNIHSNSKKDIIIPHNVKSMRFKYIILRSLYKNNTLQIPPDMIEEATHLLDGKIPSTWFMLLYLFLKYSHCKEIGLFGFSFSDFNRINNCKSHSDTHNFEKEKEVVEKFLIENSEKLKLFI